MRRTRYDDFDALKLDDIAEYDVQRLNDFQINVRKLKTFIVNLN